LIVNQKKDKRPTKVTASARRKNAAENPPKKRSRKRQAKATETAHPKGVRGPDWIEFGQNPNHIGYSGLSLVK
ncbi:hypothetical protein A2U01_0075448, partial [Trifolium medium]|nr:hypothetical protein [Trifolium medium]